MKTNSKKLWVPGLIFKLLLQLPFNCKILKVFYIQNLAINTHNMSFFILNNLLFIFSLNGKLNLSIKKRLYFFNVVNYYVAHLRQLIAASLLKANSLGFSLWNPLKN